MLKKSLTDPDVISRKSGDPARLIQMGLSVSNFAKTMGLSRTLVYSLIGSGTIKTIKLGDRRIIPASEVTRLLETAA
jgi:excisionase family DNA binding protein